MYTKYHRGLLGCITSISASNAEDKSSNKRKRCMFLRDEGKDLYDNLWPTTAMKNIKK